MAYESLLDAVDVLSKSIGRLALPDVAFFLKSLLSLLRLSEADVFSSSKRRNKILDLVVVAIGCGPSEDLLLAACTTLKSTLLAKKNNDDHGKLLEVWAGAVQVGLEGSDLCPTTRSALLHEFNTCSQLALQRLERDGAKGEVLGLVQAADVLISARGKCGSDDETKHKMLLKLGQLLEKCDPLPPQVINATLESLHKHLPLLYFFGQLGSGAALTRFSATLTKIISAPFVRGRSKKASSVAECRKAATVLLAAAIREHSRRALQSGRDLFEDAFFVASMSDLSMSLASSDVKGAVNNATMLASFPREVLLDPRHEVISCNDLYTLLLNSLGGFVPESLRLASLVSCFNLFVEIATNGMHKGRNIDNLYEMSQKVTRCCAREHCDQPKLLGESLGVLVDRFQVVADKFELSLDLTNFAICLLKTLVTDVHAKTDGVAYAADVFARLFSNPGRLHLAKGLLDVVEGACRETWPTPIQLQTILVALLTALPSTSSATSNYHQVVLTAVSKMLTHVSGSPASGDRNLAGSVRELAVKALDLGLIRLEDVLLRSCEHRKTTFWANVFGEWIDKKTTADGSSRPNGLDSDLFAVLKEPRQLEVLLKHTCLRDAKPLLDSAIQLSEECGRTFCVAVEKTARSGLLNDELKVKDSDEDGEESPVYRQKLLVAYSKCFNSISDQEWTCQPNFELPVLEPPHLFLGSMRIDLGSGIRILRDRKLLEAMVELICEADYPNRRRTELLSLVCCRDDVAGDILGKCLQKFVGELIFNGDLAQVLDFLLFLEHSSIELGSPWKILVDVLEYICCLPADKSEPAILNFIRHLQENASHVLELWEKLDEFLWATSRFERNVDLEETRCAVDGILSTMRLRSKDQFDVEVKRERLSEIEMDVERRRGQDFRIRGVLLELTDFCPCAPDSPLRRNLLDCIGAVASGITRLHEEDAFQFAMFLSENDAWACLGSRTDLFKNILVAVSDTSDETIMLKSLTRMGLTCNELGAENLQALEKHVGNRLEELRRTSSTTCSGKEEQQETFLAIIEMLPLIASGENGGTNLWSSAIETAYTGEVDGMKIFDTIVGVLTRRNARGCFEALLDVWRVCLQTTRLPVDYRIGVCRNVLCEVIRQCFGRTLFLKSACTLAKTVIEFALSKDSDAQIDPPEEQIWMQTLDALLEQVPNEIISCLVRGSLRENEKGWCRTCQSRVAPEEHGSWGSFKAGLIGRCRKIQASWRRRVGVGNNNVAAVLFSAQLPMRIVAGWPRKSVANSLSAGLPQSWTRLVVDGAVWPIGVYSQHFFRSTSTPETSKRADFIYDEYPTETLEIVEKSSGKGAEQTIDELFANFCTRCSQFISDVFMTAEEPFDSKWLVSMLRVLNENSDGWTDEKKRWAAINAKILLLNVLTKVNKLPLDKQLETAILSAAQELAEFRSQSQPSKPNQKIGVPFLTLKAVDALLRWSCQGSKLSTGTMHELRKLLDAYTEVHNEKRVRQLSDKLKCMWPFPVDCKVPRSSRLLKALKTLEAIEKNDLSANERKLTVLIRRCLDDRSGNRKRVRQAWIDCLNKSSDGVEQGTVDEHILGFETLLEQRQFEQAFFHHEEDARLLCAGRFDPKIANFAQRVQEVLGQRQRILDAIESFEPTLDSYNPPVTQFDL